MVDSPPHPGPRRIRAKSLSRQYGYARDCSSTELRHHRQSIGLVSRWITEDPDRCADSQPVHFRRVIVDETVRATQYGTGGWDSHGPVHCATAGLILRTQTEVENRRRCSSRASDLLSNHTGQGDLCRSVEDLFVRLLADFRKWIVRARALSEYGPRHCQQRDRNEPAVVCFH